MSKTSVVDVEYLKVPGNQNSTVLSQRAESNVSLLSTTSSIRRQGNPSPRRLSTAPHLSVHYTPETNKIEEKIEILPTFETSPLVKEKYVKNHRRLKIPTQYGLRELLHKSPMSPNSFLSKRSNDENADAYKIFSILYGLVIFIGGVAFSISHAIIPTEEAENIKHLAEIYFTYLYWVSIFWILFCIFDIVHHRHKININSKSPLRLDSNHVPVQSGNLRLSGNKSSSPLLNDQHSNTAPMPHFNLQLFDDSDEFQSQDNEKNISLEQLGISPPKRTQKDDDEEEDENNDEGNLTNLRQSRYKSQSLDNLSSKSVNVLRKRSDQTRDVSFRRRALDLGDVHNLRNYVRHRKDSIVQRVIGYNYDDHSTAGGLYIRVGIGIFCLGTVIHSGLSILSNMENLPCTRWTAVVDDFSRLLFSFIQFFFIFKHSNLIIRAHESLARLAVMHIVVTNLCVWFRMVVIETKSQIIESGIHESAISPITEDIQTMNISQALLQKYRSQIHTLSCLQAMESTQHLSSFINEGYMRLKPLLYPCTIEFSLMCLTLFYLIWENIGKTFAYKMSDKASTKNVFMVNCHASIKGLFAGMIIFSGTAISIILYAVFRNKIGEDVHHVESFTLHSDSFSQHKIYSRAILHHATRTTTTTAAAAIVNEYNFLLAPLQSTHGSARPIIKTPQKILYSIAIVEIVNLCLLSISLLATLWALFKIRKLQYQRTTTRFDDVLIIVSLTGTYLYSIFSAFALLNNKNQSTWLAYLKIIIVVLEFIEGTIHAFFILVALRKKLHRKNKHQYPAREIITLLIMLDLSLWFEATTTTTKHEANPFQLAFYHIIPWSIIAAIATPLQIFFRFHASVCLSHVWENMYILPAYEHIALHGL